jgi:hypothetical protein
VFSLLFFVSGNVMRANFVVRGVMANGRFSDAYGSCDRGARGP